MTVVSALGNLEESLLEMILVAIKCESSETFWRRIRKFNDGKVEPVDVRMLER